LRALDRTRKDQGVTSLFEAPAGPVRGALSGARRALIDFAECEPPTQSDIDRVMRALASHDDWYVPVLYAGHAWGQARFDHSLIFPDAVGPQTSLMVFTDLDAAQLAEGEAIGVYGGPVTGVRLLSGLVSVDALVVNHGSPREQQWYIAAAGFAVASAWGTAIAVERALADRGNGPAPAAALLGHTYQLLLEQSSRSLTQVYLPDIDGAVAVAFTATDRAEEFISSLPIATRPLADLAPLPGHQLFETMRDVGAAGLVINAGSDDQTALTREDITEILSS
jgi:hypothetical protein